MAQAPKNQFRNSKSQASRRDSQFRPHQQASPLAERQNGKFCPPQSTPQWPSLTLSIPVVMRAAAGLDCTALPLERRLERVRVPGTLHEEHPLATYSVMLFLKGPMESLPRKAYRS